MSRLGFACVCCHAPAEDEYHWWHEEKDGSRQEIVWMLCEKCCEFAVDVVESISELDNEEERETWPKLT